MFKLKYYNLLSYAPTKQEKISIQYDYRA